MSEERQKKQLWLAAHQPVEKAQEYIAEGCHWVVDRDPEKFFDRVNHDGLMAKIEERISDKRVLKLIGAFLAVADTAGGMEGGLVNPVDEGMRLRFARYADDSNIYVRSQRAGERVMESITRFIATKLKLKVNQQTSVVARPWEALHRFKGRARELMSRTIGVSAERVAGDLTRCLRGWPGYFGRCETPSVREGREQWLRCRLRSAIRKQWKRAKVRFVELRKRGVGQDLAAQKGGSSHGPWRVGDSPGLHIALFNAYFDSSGIPRLINCTRIAQLAELPDTDPHVRWCRRGGREVAPSFINFSLCCLAVSCLFGKQNSSLIDLVSIQDNYLNGVYGVPR